MEEKFYTRKHFCLKHQDRLLNIRTEIMEGCHHKIKFRLIGRKNAADKIT